MAVTLTDNYNLRKPDASENVSNYPEQQNANMDAIDEALKALADRISALESK